MCHDRGTLSFLKLILLSHLRIRAPRSGTAGSKTGTGGSSLSAPRPQPADRAAPRAFGGLLGLGPFGRVVGGQAHGAGVPPPAPLQVNDCAVPTLAEAPQ